MTHREIFALLGIEHDWCEEDGKLRAVPSLRVTYRPKDESVVAFALGVVFWLIIRGGC